jgi:prephenate dehydrogenase
VIGGLIGGSLSLALKATGSPSARWSVSVAAGPTWTKPWNLRVIDRDCQDLWPTAASDADVMFLATPVLALAGGSQPSCPICKPGTILTDGGSVKQAVVDEIEPLLPRGSTSSPAIRLPAPSTAAPRRPSPPSTRGGAAF